VWLTPHPRDLIQPEGERERDMFSESMIVASLMGRVIHNFCQ